MSNGAIRLGFLYPGHAAEDDYPWLAGRLQPTTEAIVVHTSVGEDAHRPDALRDLGSTRRLLDGADELHTYHPHSAIWACTSGSFVFGWEGAQRQVALLRRRLPVPWASTSFSFVAAALALGVRRVAVAASYPSDVAELFVEFLAHGKIETVALGSAGIVTAAEVGTAGKEQVLDMVTGNDDAAADAVLLPDTALHTVRWLDALESAAGKPVITANQATIWHAWQLSGRSRPQEGFGALFRTAGEINELAPPVG